MFLKNNERLFALTFSLLIAVLIVFSHPVQALGDVRVVSHSSFYNIFNTLWVVGEVENIGDMATRFTKITATFYNSSNQVIGSEYGYADLDVLLPGRKSSFDILFDESDGSLNVHNYTLAVSWDNYAAGKPLGIEILSSSNYIDGYGYMHVIGEVRNQGTLNANFTQVFATFYDSSGTVVGTDWDFTDPTHLTPNEIGAFDVELIYTQQVIKVASYSLTAESTQYAYNPSPSPTPSPTPTPTTTPTPTPTPTATPTPTPSATPTPTPQPTASPTPTPTPSLSPSPSPTPTASPLPTSTPSPSPTPSSSPSPSPTPEEPSTTLYITLGMIGAIGAVAIIAIFLKRQK